MSNYYLRHVIPACSHCGRGPDTRMLHIGSSAAGWCFGLRVYLDAEKKLEHFGVDRITELADWRPLFVQFPIFDDSERQITAADMIAIITQRSHPTPGRQLISRLTAGREHMGPYEVRNTTAGDGTYDLCNYEFS